MKTISYEDFCEEYKPIKNYFDDNASFDGHLYETFGKELEYVRKTQSYKIWTLVDDDYGNPVIVPGYRFVNRIGYFITVNPWEDNKSELIVTLDD